MTIYAERAPLQLSKKNAAHPVVHARVEAVVADLDSR